MKPSCPQPKESPTQLYLDLLKRCVTDLVYEPRDPERIEGKVWPARAHTMIGLLRLDSLQHCIENIITDNVPGDLIETGVWRGGACIFMRAVLKAYCVDDRRVWVADSFNGVPPPDAEKYPADAGLNLNDYPVLAVAIEAVRESFARYDLLDDQVGFIEGWFRDTLPTAPIQRLAVLRLDGDLYESTMDALTNLYPKLSVGGYVIVDDYGAIGACAQAVHDFRKAHNIADDLVRIDWSGVLWRRSR